MSYVIKAVARPLEGKAPVRVVGEYEDYDTAVRQCRAMEERCRVARGIILDYADIEFPVVRFTVGDGEINNESDKKPTVEEVALVMQDRLDPSKHRTLNTWKEIVEFIHANTKRTLNADKYTSLYWESVNIYDDEGMCLDRYLSSATSLAEYKKRIAELELDFKNGKIKILSNGEVIELV